MKTKPNQAIRELRKVIGRTQSEFAAMIGASKDTVVSWERGRNRLSVAFARRIAFATGVDGRLLLAGVSIPMVNQMLGEPKVYTGEDFERYRRTEWGRSDEEGSRRHLVQCVDALELLLMAATRTGGGMVRYRLPGVLDSFIQWCEQTKEEFKLGPQIDEQLRKRKFKAGVTLTYGEWRAMAKEAGGALRAAGFRNDRRKGDEDKLRLELELMPGWAPGRRMKPPRPAMMNAVMKDENRSRERT